MTPFALAEWFSHPPGRLILDSEIRQFRELLPNLFGYHLLVVGGHRADEMVATSRILTRTILHRDEVREHTGLTGVQAEAGAIPVQSDSVDVVLLPHVLEFDDHPHGSLREAERILVPEGHLIISGFNPWGMMGLWRWFQADPAGTPWGGRFLGLARIKDWLALLGIDVVSTRTSFFRPPFRNERLMHRLEFLEPMGARAWPYLAGVYLLLARKRVTTLTPIKTRWKPRRLVSVGLAEPSASFF